MLPHPRGTHQTPLYSLYLHMAELKESQMWHLQAKNILKMLHLSFFIPLFYRCTSLNFVTHNDLLFLAQAVCCEDMKHCCPGGSTCDVKECKCVSLSTNKEMPMWAKLPARKIAEWERVKGVTTGFLHIQTVTTCG